MAKALLCILRDFAVSHDLPSKSRAAVLRGTNGLVRNNTTKGV